MNDQTFQELTRFADRIVGPVFASRSRKCRMREELLAHLVDAFEEELARQTHESGEPGDGEQETALRATLARFGEPCEVTSQLQHVAAMQDPLRVHVLPFVRSLTLAFVGHYVFDAMFAIAYTAFLFSSGIHFPNDPRNIVIMQIISCLRPLIIGFLFTRWIPTNRPHVVVPLAACLEAGLPLALPISFEPPWFYFMMMIRDPAATFLGCMLARRPERRASRVSVAE